MGILSLPLEDWTSVAERIRAADRPIAWCWAAARSTQGEWKLAALTVRGATLVAERHLEYEALLLHTEQTSAADAADRFLRGKIGSVAGLEGLALPISGPTYPYWMTTEPTGQYYLSRPVWPEFYFNNTFGSSADVSVRMGDLLNKKGLPFYPSVQAAFAELLYGLPPTDLQSNFNPHVLVRLPDLRARFGQVRFEDGLVQLTVEEGKPDGAKGCAILATWRRNPGDRDWVRADLPITSAETARLETDEIPAELWALLVDAQGNVLDRYGWSDTLGQQPETLGSLLARVARWLTEGEHHQLEYKQELGSRANRSFAETVAAFANGEGGVVLVGVADDAAVIGYGQPKVEDQVANIVRELVVEPADVQVERVSIEERPVYVVTVRPGEPGLKPYRVGGRVMVRVMGTTREATTAEIRRLVRGDEPLSGDSLRGLSSMRWRGRP
ncbi:MAG: ATP-binding protein [Candidatus Dormibacteraeota bacterium]|nr:ATP-binding protein [Candidatus Dormibacteraeota bacterium]